MAHPTKNNIIPIGTAQMSPIPKGRACRELAVMTMPAVNSRIAITIPPFGEPAGNITKRIKPMPAITPAIN
jgi:hypothetical protein